MSNGRIEKPITYRRSNQIFKESIGNGYNSKHAINCAPNDKNYQKLQLLTNDFPMPMPRIDTNPHPKIDNRHSVSNRKDIQAILNQNKDKNRQTKAIEAAYSIKAEKEKIVKTFSGKLTQPLVYTYYDPLETNNYQSEKNKSSNGERLQIKCSDRKTVNFFVPQKYHYENEKLFGPKTSNKSLIKQQFDLLSGKKGIERSINDISQKVQHKKMSDISDGNDLNNTEYDINISQSTVMNKQISHGPSKSLNTSSTRIGLGSKRSTNYK